jgi:hypothetical protein
MSGDFYTKVDAQIDNRAGRYFLEYLNIYG